MKLIEYCHSPSERIESLDRDNMVLLTIFGRISLSAFHSDELPKVGETVNYKGGEFTVVSLYENGKWGDLTIERKQHKAAYYANDQVYKALKKEKKEEEEKKLEITNPILNLEVE
jgi:hypothetical protein